MTKKQLARWLLISLIPVVIIFIAIVAIADPDVTGPTLAVTVILILYVPPALVTGLILLIWTNVVAKRMFNNTQRYAELHGWLPISRTQWRNRKRNQIRLAVNKAAQRNTFILTIEAEGETFTIEEFESSVWALQFGEWIWQELLTNDDAKVDVEVISEKRTEWIESNALAIRQSSITAR